MKRDELLAKIRKCLALAKSANEHEAAAALAKARELMDLHGLDEGDVALSEIGEASIRGTRAVTPPAWEMTLVATVERATNCQSLFTARGDVSFVGRGAAPTIATYAFSVLFRQLKRARQEYLKGELRRCTLARKRMRADSFCRGWASAVYIKICQLVPPEPTDPMIGAFLTKQYGELQSIEGRQAKTPGTVGLRDFSRGTQRGRDVDLHAGVGGGAAPRQIEYRA